MLGKPLIKEWNEDRSQSGLMLIFNYLCRQVHCKAWSQIYFSGNSDQRNPNVDVIAPSGCMMHHMGGAPTVWQYSQCQIIKEAIDKPLCDCQLTCRVSMLHPSGTQNRLNQTLAQELNSRVFARGLDSMSHSRTSSSSVPHHDCCSR